MLAHSRCDKRYRIKNRAKYLAHKAIDNAMRRRKITKPDKCSKCGAGGRIVGHHSDYNKPLEVVWICEPCHREIHAT
jgi:hypothetical protein